eukprot:12337421-Heterocapsa_arctica.AAC.1
MRSSRCPASLPAAGGVLWLPGTRTMLSGGFPAPLLRQRGELPEISDRTCPPACWRPGLSGSPSE